VPQQARQLLASRAGTLCRTPPCRRLSLRRHLPCLGLIRCGGEGWHEGFVLGQWVLSEPARTQGACSSSTCHTWFKQTGGWNEGCLSKDGRESMRHTGGPEAAGAVTHIQLHLYCKSLHRHADCASRINKQASPFHPASYPPNPTQLCSCQALTRHDPEPPRS
jgi:hypothetical protein